MKKLVCFIFLLIFISCSSKETTYEEMKADELLSESFTENELKNLAKIVDFFESEICLDKKITKEFCYFNFNKKIIKEFEKEIVGYKFPINYQLQKKLYSSIDSIFFKEIWVHKTYLEGADLNNKIIDKAYNLNLYGKYILFLKRLKNDDKLFNDFYKVFYLSNEISFGVQASAFLKFKIKEFKGIKRRLFFAIYYLTVNDKMHNYINRKI